MTKTRVVGWIISFAGSGLWCYGYISVGNPPIFDWHANGPAWIASFLPNIESEIGMALAFAGMIPMYWPVKR